tara:strand:+ start:6057 stop:7250 length:1194 start_codon:yes stop_codon:yes gene_type:complete
MNDLYGPIDEKKRKLTKKPSSEKNLGDWFKRQGAPGKKGGWVDCNTCRKGKCKACGRKKGEKRSKYPRCRPTPSACKGYKKPKKENLTMDLELMIREELQNIFEDKESDYRNVTDRMGINSSDSETFDPEAAMAAQNAKIDFNQSVIEYVKQKLEAVGNEWILEDDELESDWANLTADTTWDSKEEHVENLKAALNSIPDWMLPDGNLGDEIFYDLQLEQIIKEELEVVLDEKKKKKQQKGKKRAAKTAKNTKKKKAKRDACYSKVKSRYKVWPSAYASGALVKCRKVGAKNWGNSKKESLEIMIEDELSQVLEEKKKKACKPSKGKRFAKRVNGKCRSFGQKGQAKGGGDRIRPGTKKGDAYCARSAKIKKCKNPPCANALSRKKWKCRGSKSMKE